MNSTDKELILVIDDDLRLNKYLCTNLEKNGYSTKGISCSADAFSTLKVEPVSLVVLDLNLGDENGMNILQIIRRQDTLLPTIIISSINDIETQLEGFNKGCDGYLTKPFYFDELLVRIKRMIKRRSVQSKENLPIYDQIAIPPFEIDIKNQSAKKNNIPLDLKKSQLELLLIFVKNKNTILTQEKLIELMFTNESSQNPKNALYVAIRRLRAAIEKDPSHPEYLHSVRGIGYKFSV